MRRPARRPGPLSAAVVLVGVATALVGAAPASADPTAVSATPAVPATAVTADATPTPGPSERVCPAATADTVTCFAERRVDVVPHAAAAAPRGYSPASLRSAYAIPASGGDGVTVAVVGAFDAPTVEADLRTYRSTFGLPALTAGQFRKVDQRGATGPLPTFNRGWADEVALDTQMVSASCPACRILLVEADSDALDAIGEAAVTAVDLGATYVSNSYGAPETHAARFASSYAAAGVTFVASTGDDGFAGGAAFPATAPGVLAVGGTRLVPADTNRGWNETAWTDAGSGCSTVFARPSAQTGVTTGCGGRAVADVSAVADPNTGVAVYNSSTGGWGVFGGTSASAPLVAGMAAIAGHPGSTAAAVYGNTSSFHDVTSGSTGSCSVAVLCTAGRGWDGPTGVGTPAGVGGFVAGDLGCGGTPATVTAATSATTAGRYVPVRPTRVLDTRSTASPLGQGVTRVVDLAPQLPAGAASAVVVNLTVTNPTAAGFVTAYPDGTARPVASNLNTTPGVTRANQATVALGAAGSGSRLALYNSLGRTDLVVDLLGYYTATGDPAAALTYRPAATPVRAVDTRTTGGPLGNSGRAGRLCVTTGLTSGGAAVTGIAAVAVTLTAVGGAGAGYLKAWNGDAAAEPTVSSLNFVAGQVVPNAAVVPVSCLDSACSRVTFAVANRISTATDVVVDVVGVYAGDAGSGLVLRPQTPQRIADSRDRFGLSPLGAGGSGGVVVPGASAAGAAAVAANVTAVAPTQGTYLTVYGATRPPTSNLNPVGGEVVAAAVVSGLDAGGTLRVYNAFGRVDVVVDVAGLFVTAS